MYYVLCIQNIIKFDNKQNLIKSTYKIMYIKNILFKMNNKKIEYDKIKKLIFGALNNNNLSNIALYNSD